MLHHAVKRLQEHPEIRGFIDPKLVYNSGKRIIMFRATIDTDLNKTDIGNILRNEFNLRPVMLQKDAGPYVSLKITHDSNESYHEDFIALKAIEGLTAEKGETLS